MSTIVVRDGVAYGVCAPTVVISLVKRPPFSPEVVAVDAESGELLWKYRLPEGMYPIETFYPCYFLLTGGDLLLLCTPIDYERSRIFSFHPSLGESLPGNLIRAELLVDGRRIDVLTNSVVTSVFYNPSSRDVIVKVGGPAGTRGFCNVTIPRDLAYWATDIRVYFDGELVNFTVQETSEGYQVCISYVHSFHELLIRLAPPYLRNYWLFLGYVTAGGATALALAIYRAWRKRLARS
jgi:hypothetical protein